MGDYNDYSHLDNQQRSLNYDINTSEEKVVGQGVDTSNRLEGDDDASGGEGNIQNAKVYLSWALADNTALQDLEAIVENNGEEDTLEDKLIVYAQDLILEDELMPDWMKNKVITEFNTELILEVLSEEKRKKIEQKRGPQRGEGAEGIFSDEVTNLINGLMRDNDISEDKASKEEFDIEKEIDRLYNGDEYGSPAIAAGGGAEDDFLMDFLIQEDDSAGKTHIVQEGDTLESIAEKYGLTKEELIELNPILETEELKKDMKLVVEERVIDIPLIEVLEGDRDVEEGSYHDHVNKYELELEDAGKHSELIPQEDASTEDWEDYYKKKQEFIEEICGKDCTFEEALDIYYEQSGIKAAEDEIKRKELLLKLQWFLGGFIAISEVVAPGGGVGKGGLVRPKSFRSTKGNKPDMDLDAARRRKEVSSLEADNVNTTQKPKANQPKKKVEDKGNLETGNKQKPEPSKEPKIEDTKKTNQVDNKNIDKERKQTGNNSLEEKVEGKNKENTSNSRKEKDANELKGKPNNGEDTELNKLRDNWENWSEKDIKLYYDKIKDKNLDLKANTPEHKAQRWEDYKKKKNTANLSYKDWFKKYDVGMANSAKTAREKYYMNMLQDGVKPKGLSTPYGKRYLDIRVGKTKKMYEVKTGKEYYSRETSKTKLPNETRIKKDEYLVQTLGYEITWILEKGASKPLLKALDDAGIKYIIGIPKKLD